jgi:hypothetical protein
MNAQQKIEAEFSIPSIIAVVAAILSFFVPAFWGFVLALVAILFGLIGVVLAFSPRVRGGLASIISMMAGFLGILVALVKTVGWLLGGGA